jgi:SAM-dependent methyltransferase
VPWVPDMSQACPVGERLSDNLRRVLRCPDCGGGLDCLDGGAVCVGCRTTYPSTAAGGIDLRLKAAKTVRVEFVLGAPLRPPAGLDFKPLKPAPAPEVDFAGVEVPFHLTSELLTHFPRAQSGQMILDLGCGRGIHRGVCERAGFEYVGLDYGAHDAMIVGDAHALPFADDSFDAILSIAVLEHIRYPFVMMRESFRVLRPRGKFIGTVAFLEPFHGDSFYHHTHLGTFNSLQDGGFHVEQIAPSDRWSVLVAQAHMGLFPRMPRFISSALVLPTHWLHKLWWRLGNVVEPKADRYTRIRNHTGAFTFIAVKPA